MAIDPSTTSHIQSEVTSSNFTLETNAHVFKMLTTNIYSDVILAGIRELSTNAIDGCKAGNLPLKYDVHVPTISNPTFSVRDYGVGISPDQMMSFYTTMGASNKRNSNSYNGQFGIGKLAPLAYATSFTVKSYFDLKIHEYLVSIDNGIPVIIKLSCKPTTEPNGLEVSYLVQPTDIAKFIKRMEFFYRFSDVKPNLSEPLDIDMSNLISISGKNWYIFENPDIYKSDAYILMANVPYTVDSYKYNIPANCVISVPTGAVSITPGRESLNYDDKTKATLKTAVEALRKDVVAKVNLDLATATTPWEQAFIAKSYLKSFQDIIDVSKLTLDSNFVINYGTTYLSDPSYNSFFLANFNGSSTSSSQAFSTYRDTTFVIQDVPSNFVTAFNAMGTACYKMIVIKPTSNTLMAIDSMMPSVNTWLNHLGIPKSNIYKASDYITKAVKSQPAAKLANSIFQPTVFTRKGSILAKRKDFNISLATNTEKYLYFEMNGSNPIDSEELILATLSLENYVPNTPLIIGVPQKVINKVKADPNFTQAESYFQSIVPTLGPIKQISHSAIAFEREFPPTYLNYYPDEIKNLLGIAELYTDSNLITSYNATMIQKFYAIDVNTLEDTDQFDISSKYPLFKLLKNYYFTSEQEKGGIIQHYFNLETNYASNPSN